EGQGEKEMRLNDKVAIITGAGHGMGEAEACLFAQEGARVMVTDILGGEAERVAADIRNAGGEASAATIDVTSEPQWKALIAKTLQTMVASTSSSTMPGSPAALSETPTASRAGTRSLPSTRPASFSAPSSPPKRWSNRAAARSSISARSWGLSAVRAATPLIAPPRARCGSI